MARVVQLTDGTTRRVALVDEPRLRLVDGVSSIYELATLANETGDALSGLVQGRANGHALDYDEVYAGRGPWRLMPPIDHPAEPARCIVSGTGLTHFGSARDRNAMHVGETKVELTDSLKMFQAGVEGGRLRIHTPLVMLSKAEIIRRGLAFGLDYGLTHSCYDPRPDGGPCGRCDSCVLRAKGFAEAGAPDPALR